MVAEPAPYLGLIRGFELLQNLGCGYPLHLFISFLPALTHFQIKCSGKKIILQRFCQKGTSGKPDKEGLEARGILLA
ncbi:hypothetical protein ES703_113347 [subsurface metagenome]